MQLTITGDIVVVADATESPCSVASLQRLHGKVPVAACGTTMNHDQVYLAHVLVFQVSGFRSANHAALHEERAECGSEYRDYEVDDFVDGFLFHIAVLFI